MPAHVMFVYSRSGIVFNLSAGAITDHSQSAKDIDNIVSPSSKWRTPATKSQNSFY